MVLTVGALKRVIKDLPDDMPIGVSGHCGEFNEIDAEPETANYPPNLVGKDPGEYDMREPYTCFDHPALLFRHTDIGEEPE